MCYIRERLRIVHEAPSLNLKSTPVKLSFEDCPGVHKSQLFPSSTPPSLIHIFASTQ